MMRTAILAIAALSVPAPAQAATLKMVSQRNQIIEGAACFVRTAPAMSRNVLALEPGKERQKKANQLLRGRWSCIPDAKLAVAVRGDIFFGELAGAMIDREPALLETLAARRARAAQRPGTGLKDGQFVVAYSDCLLAAEPGKTANILRAARGSPAERSAVVAYGQTLSDCMPTDISYAMNIPDLRAHLAYAAYRSLLSERVGTAKLEAAE